MNHVALKFAVSTIVLTMTLTGCPSDYGFATSSALANAARNEQPSRLEGQARTALHQGDPARAAEFAERAVELAPRDVGYRMLLADIYLRGGRFQSAASAYGDVLELDPGNARAGLSFALAQIALGRPGAAVAQLDALRETAPAADLGLAYALAGYPERAIELMEPAARQPGATGRLRQNLALSYALAGDWERARAVAAQDVSPADLGQRLEQWAALARPDASGTVRVASLLGVTPQADPGQPARLALRAAQPVAEQAPAAFVEAAPSPVDLSGIRYASAAPFALPQPPAAPEAPVAAPVADPAPSEEFVQPEVDFRYAAAVEALVTPEPAVLRAAPAVVARPPAPIFERPRARPASATVAPRASGVGRFAVQIGAFSNAENAERAWQQAERRFGLAGEQPLTTTIDMNGRTLHRVSVAGFASHGDASRVCGQIKARGGACFVRAVAGDAAVRWAARYGPSRRGNA